MKHITKSLLRNKQKSTPMQNKEKNKVDLQHLFSKWNATNCRRLKQSWRRSSPTLTLSWADWSRLRNNRNHQQVSWLAANTPSKRHGIAWARVQKGTECSLPGYGQPYLTWRPIILSQLQFSRWWHHWEQMTVVLDQMFEGPPYKAHTHIERGESYEGAPVLCPPGKIIIFKRLCRLEVLEKNYKRGGEGKA